MNIITLAQTHSWLIVGLPVLSFIIIALAIILSGKSQAFARAIAPWAIILCLAGSLTIAVGALLSMLAHAGGDLTNPSSWFSHTITWMTPEPVSASGINHTLKIGVLLDPLSAVMLVVVSLVSLLVQIYSCGYMKREEYPRFYLYMSLFTASMLGLVISSTLLQLFLCWELVGLCSYLLIGFWFTKPEAARAAIKAFVVTRFGDLGLLIAVIALWKGYGDLSFINLYNQIAIAHNLAPAALPLSLTVIGILLFFGACGKSAQFPLHIWLPDAMEGPTSVSALIHAATMVAAGVFLIARMFFLFQAAPLALIVVVVIGGFTALFAASIALAQTDMKKVMAYSTISQLGYMMMGLGLAAPAAAFFHLTTHALFKALLFLTAGSVIHATHTQNMWEMGGLFSKMKTTAITCLIGGLALAGIFPMAGFFSKDKLLESALAVALGHGEAAQVISPALAWLILIMALCAVLMTAFYTTRMWVLVFLGKPRSEGAEHAHEAPGSMRCSLIVLAALTCVSGFVLVPRLTAMVAEEHEALGQSLIWGMTGVATLLALTGILWGYRTYSKVPAVDPLRKLGWVYTGMVNLWYVNAFFTWLARRVVLVFGVLIAHFDKGVVDGGLVDGTAWLTGRFGNSIRRLSAGALPGQLQYYALVLFAIAALVMLGMSAHEYLNVASIIGGCGR
ncbi:MAG TPA: NADH-quinone oxidoreductase subunit L [Armatimonadota bacterium]|nr:NADH-quinone oxidoreductase subunit L [Armatimonadota bacterium]